MLHIITSLIKNFIQYFLSIVMILGLLISCGPDNEDIIQETEDSNTIEEPQSFDLGRLSVSTSFGLPFALSENGGKAVYTFAVDQEFDYLVKVNEGIKITLRNEKEIIYATNNELITSASPYSFISSGMKLTPGLYSVELQNEQSIAVERGELELFVGDLNLNDRDFVVHEGMPFMNFDFDLTNEPDDHIQYTFELKYDVALYTFEVPEGAKMIFYNEEEEIIASSDDGTELRGEGISKGLYHIKIRSANPYAFETGVLDLHFERDTDVNLGELSIPYRKSFEYTIENEWDHKKIYSFSIQESTNYFIKSDQGVQLKLMDEQGNVLAHNTQSITDSSLFPEVENGLSLSPGNFSLEISYPHMRSSSGNLEITLRDARESDIDLGTLEVPSIGWYHFKIANGEPDNGTLIRFEIEQEASYKFSSSDAVFLSALYNEAGQNINGVYDSVLEGINLQPGGYELFVITEEFDPHILGQIQIEFIQE